MSASIPLKNNPLTLFEFDKVVDVEEKDGAKGTAVPVPSRVFTWLKEQCLKDSDDARWLKLTQHERQYAIQVTSYVGVIRAPCGFLIEVLPKTGKQTPDEARKFLIEMLKCLGFAEFKHIKTANADLRAKRMPLWEVFIQQFLLAVHSLVKRGLRSDYVARQENLFALRGRLLVARQISQNLVRPDRFFTEHDEFLQDRAENRLIHTALRHVLAMCQSPENQRVARELSFVFADVPRSVDVTLDFQRIRLDRGMSYYESALNWAKLILRELSPITGVGEHHAPSLLFPMEKVFEAYVAKHLKRQLRDGYTLKAQASSKYLVKHEGRDWFRLKPDLLVQKKHGKNCLILDTKWKLLDAKKKKNRNDKYDLSQADFYQLYAYGHNYLVDGNGDLVLIYPKTDTFPEQLPVFEFQEPSGKMRLWVLPFCLKEHKLILPPDKTLDKYFDRETRRF
jgi:5-methylcytosine-specific restriction enzyme subunit McrC